MEKLELKYIVGYLPYGLKIQLLKKDGLIEKMCMGFTNIGVLVVPDNGHGLIETHIHTIKPILRPLSDLTKKIEVNGEKFVPIVELLKIEYPSQDKEGKYSIIEVSEKCYPSACFKYQANRYVTIFTNYIENEKYWIIQKLYEWHFDLHNLIEKGLAIDLNTINNGIQ